MNIEQRQAMTRAINKLESMKDDADPEAAHGDAEDALCEFLREVGYGDAADAFEAARDRVGFWYA